MRTTTSILTVAAGAAALAGCAAGPRSTATRAPIPASPTLSLSREAPAPRVAGLAGRNAAALVSLFGQPALDVREGSARKLQFLGPDCVLDAYLYPQQRGEAVVTHVDARLPDGRDTDQESCAASLRRR